MKNKIPTLIVVILLLIGGAFVTLNFYSYIFARTVEGEISAVERVLEQSGLIVQGAVPSSQVFSFAVAVKEKSGEIVTASSEDRQWAVAQKGQCVVAKYYPYPPWNLEKAGTYFNARLLKLSDCGSNGAH